MKIEKELSGKFSRILILMGDDEMWTSGWCRTLINLLSSSRDFFLWILFISVMFPMESILILVKQNLAESNTCVTSFLLFLQRVRLVKFIHVSVRWWRRWKLSMSPRIIFQTGENSPIDQLMMHKSLLTIETCSCQLHFKTFSNHLKQVYLRPPPLKNLFSSRKVQMSWNLEDMLRV